MGERYYFSIKPPYPSLRVRLVAVAIDTALVLVLLSLCRRGYVGTFMQTLPTLYILALLTTVYIISGYSFFSSTYGKLVLGMRIVTTDGERGYKMGFMRGWVRLGGMLLGALPVFLGYFYAITNVERQSFHDKVAGTLVIFDDS